MNLFIDTNVFLSFYHFSSDDLEELRKLAVLLRQEEVRLFLPKQICYEFQRNRAAKIADALRRLKQQKLNLQFPQISKDYEEYADLRRAQREYQEHHAELIGKIEQDVKDKSLKADMIIQELFELAELITTDGVLLEAARIRMDIGNPPGKKGSCGDAINWEALLQEVPRGEALYFVTDDGDYFSPLDDNSFDPFLIQDWKDSKDSQLIFYRKLSLLFRDKFPDIELASELEKDLLIQQLATSPNFAETHRIIARLFSYSDFTSTQINDIIEAAITNNQVYWIIEDHDVANFFNDIVGRHQQFIATESLREIRRLLGEQEDVTHYEDIPF
jgi:hypothetical protein